MLTAENIIYMVTEPAPAEWESIDIIRASYPKEKVEQVNLKRIPGTFICMWWTCTAGVWKPASEPFLVIKSNSL